MYKLTIEKFEDKQDPSSCRSSWVDVAKLVTETLDVPAVLDFILKNGSLREHSPTFGAVTGLSYMINPEKHGVE